MNPEEALNILDKATQPGVELSRADYVTVQQALVILDGFVTENTKDKKDK